MQLVLGGCDLILLSCGEGGGGGGQESALLVRCEPIQKSSCRRSNLKRENKKVENKLTDWQHTGRTCNVATFTVFTRIQSKRGGNEPVTERA